MSDTVDTDLEVFEKAGSAVFILDKELRKANLREDWASVNALDPKARDARDALMNARLKLLQAGIVTTPGDLAEMEAIKKEIDDAADTQAMVQGAIKLIGFLAKFA